MASPVVVPRCLRLSGPLAVLLLLGCTVLTGPELPDLPEEDLSLDPARLAEGATVYLCGRWFNRPAGPWALVDVFLYIDYEPPAGGPPSGPTAAVRKIVTQHGARIVKPFHVQGMRVWMPTESIPGLVAAGAVVTSVPDPARYDLVITVYSQRPLTSEDLEPVVALGGRVQENYLFLPGARVLIPNRSLIALAEQVRHKRIGWDYPTGCGF